MTRDQVLRFAAVAAILFLLVSSSARLHAQNCPVIPECSIPPDFDEAKCEDPSPGIEVDPSYLATPPYPAHSPNSGPRLKVDRTHNNLHTPIRGYQKLGQLLARDGYKVTSFETAWTPSCLAFETSQECKDDPTVPATCPFCQALAQTDILVVANPSDTFPSHETGLLRDWIEDYGGACC